MAVDKTYKLKIGDVLSAIDRKDLNFYSNLTDDEKKGYTPLILMRFMSLMSPQSSNAAYAVLATNDLVNVNFWELSKYPDLQHLLLCLAGIKGKHYRQWIASKKSKKNNKLISWILELHPEYNETEADIFLSSFNDKSWETFLKQSGIDDKKVKELTAAWKNKNQ